MYLISLCARLLYNGLRYRYYRMTGARVRPQALSMEITRRCVAKCIMCNIWKTPVGATELSVEEWLNLLAAPVLGDLREVDITGGEPFLREDIGELLAGVFNLKDGHLKHLRSVAITTNGFLTDKIFPVLSQAARAAKDKAMEIVIAFAMDGIGSVHDEIRRVKGGWERLNESIQKTKEIRSEYGNVVIGLKTTVLPANVGELEGIADYANEHQLFTIISPFIVTPNRYDNESLKSALHFSSEDIEKMLAFFKGPRFMWDYHREMLTIFLREGRVSKPCSAGFNYFFVRSNGEVFPCPIIKQGLGSVKNDSFDRLISSPAAVKFRRIVGSYGECQLCTEPGLERYALPFEGFHYLNMCLKMGSRKFLNLHEHMGLSKYVGERSS